MAQDALREIGIVGLGKMGGNLALQALEKDIKVVGADKKEPPNELKEAGLIFASKFTGFQEHLRPPRAIFLYIPAGPVVDSVMVQLAERLEPGDIIIDGGNSYWGDSIRRHQRLQKNGLHFLDLGTSGGVEGARHGTARAL